MIKLDISDSVAVLTLDNPKNLNALGTGVINEIYEKVAGIEEKANVLLITGCGKAFAAGVDVTEINKLSFEEAFSQNFIDEKWEAVFNVKIPVIAAVSGYALGGGFELALMSDIIIASENAVFGFPEVNLGIMPGLGGSQFLTKIVGPKIASELIMTGRFITAREAFDLGIVSVITENDKLMQTAAESAKTIAEKSAVSVRMIKQAIRMAQNSTLSQGIINERNMFRSLFSTEAKRKNVAAFLNKKK